MSEVTLKRKNLMVEPNEVRRLRLELGARSESEAVRIAVHEQLATAGIQNALRALRKRGTLRDVFNRLPARNR